MNKPMIRVCIDADCPKCGWVERWADLYGPNSNESPTFGCNKCDYTSKERNA